MRASCIAEETGIRAVAIVTTGFGRQASAIAEILGQPQVGIAEYPGMVVTDSEAAFHTKVAGTVVSSVLSGLKAELAPVPAGPVVSQSDAAFEGTLSDVQEYFLARGWSDGLPVIPPTARRVREFLRYTDRAPDQVIGVLPPDRQEATIGNVAVNGVMAGCRPEYMPILIAAVEAIADIHFQLEDAGSTPGWEPLVIVSGPLAAELDFNSGAGLARIGRQANSSVGRFMRLYMRNVAGLRIPPGSLDRASIGMGLNVAVAENEDAVRSINWPTFGQDRGYAASDNLVTVQSVVAISGPIYSSGVDAESHLKLLTEVFAQGTCGYWAYTGPKFGEFHPLLIISPGVAAVLASAGYTKATVRRYLHDHALIEVSKLRYYSRQASGNEVDLAERVHSGVAPAVFVQPLPGGLVPIFPWPDSIGIVVAGDPDRNQSKGLCNNHSQGVPVTKRIVLPVAWSDMRARG